jgi:hypothetical protein
MNLSQIKHELINHPSREFLTEIVNGAEGLPALVKSMVYVSISGLSDADLSRFSKIGAAAIQYIENNDPEGLKSMLVKLQVPEPFIGMINQYAANIPKHK